MHRCYQWLLFTSEEQNAPCNNVDNKIRSNKILRQNNPKCRKDESGSFAHQQTTASLLTVAETARKHVAPNTTLSKCCV